MYRAHISKHEALLTHSAKFPCGASVFRTVPLAFSLFFPDLQLAIQMPRLPELWPTPQFCSATLIYVLQDPWCAFSQLSHHMVLKIMFSGLCLWHQIENRDLSPLSAWYMSTTLKVLKTYCWLSWLLLPGQLFMGLPGRSWGGGLKATWPNLVTLVSGTALDTLLWTDQNAKQIKTKMNEFVHEYAFSFPRQSWRCFLILKHFWLQFLLSALCVHTDNKNVGNTVFLENRWEEF